MLAHTRRGPLICSVLFGALIMSCQAPSAPAVGANPLPAARGAAETTLAPPKGGLQDSEPAPEAAPAPPGAVQPPAPRAIPTPAPQVPAPAPPWRPGGVPPGAEQVILPGPVNGTDTTLDQWLKDMHKACKKAHYGPNCLNLHINYDPAGKPHNNCMWSDQDPAIGTPVTTSRLIKLEVTCDPLPTPNAHSHANAQTHTYTQTHASANAQAHA